MTLKEKLEKANDNISILISEIISLKQQRDNMYCCNVEAMDNNTCDSNCDECKEKFYDNMEDDLNNKYQIK